MMKSLRSTLASVLVLFCATQCFAQSPVHNKDNKISAYQYMKKLNSVFDYVEQNYVDELDPKILYEGAIKGMLDAIGDPYTLYLDPDYMRDLNDTTEGSFGGVGLSISKAIESTPEKPAYVEVASPIEDTPGARAGILAGDLITAIDGMPTPDMTMNDVLAKLRGKIGEPVTVSVRRGTNMNFDVTLIRALIEVPTVKYGMIGDTGYVRLIQFTPETPHRVQEALDSFEQNHYKNLIIDLRDNPGGLITSVVEIADKFIDNGPIVSTKSRLLFENHVYNASKAKTLSSTKNKPIVVLINRGSASASEILSGALKDNHLALLVGDRTYGKGSVQQVIPLSEVDGMKITMARYYTPSDTNIDKIGIPPDVEIKFPDLTEEAEKAYVEMVKDNVIENYLAEKGKLSEKEIAAYAATLAKKYPLEERLLRRLIRIQVNKTEPSALYDLDYDIQLLRALELLERKDFNSMVQNAKTLKELQSEVQLEEEK
ncbi:MAG: S41 family peptidase [Treponema sp.]|nr:S41 family peptidase [Treponema sp.]